MLSFEDCEVHTHRIQLPLTYDILRQFFVTGGPQMGRPHEIPLGRIELRLLSYPSYFHYSLDSHTAEVGSTLGRLAIDH